MVNINTIYFDFDKWNIRPDAAKELDKVIQVMKEHPSIVIEAGSHTDSRAREAYNQVLSEKRANASMAYLIAGGIDPSRLMAKGYGEMQLVNNCSSFVECSREEHQLNRRTEFVIFNDRDRFAKPSTNGTTADLKAVSNGENTPNSTNLVSNASSKVADSYIKIDPIYFEFDKWSLSNKELEELDNVVEIMNQNPAIVVEAGAHTDSKNREAYNQILSDKRAKTVVEYIVSKGIAPNRISGKGYGEMRLVNHCRSFVKCSAEEQQANRRIEFMIVDGNGYPEQEIIEKTDAKLINTNPIYFDNDKYDIRRDAAYELNRVVRILKDNPAMIIEAGSHTDSKNTEFYNQGLSEKRAKSVKSYLVTKGIASNRIVSRGYGEMQLTNQCKSFVKCSPEEHQANRRTEFKIIKL